MRKLMVLSALILLLGSVALAGNNAQIRVVHASPDAPTVDVLANDGLLFGGADFRGITGYETVPANVYNAKVVPAGGMPGDAVIDADVNLFYNQAYTVVAVNFLDSIEPIVLEDSKQFVPRSKSRLRFLHASPDAPAVDIKVVDGPFLWQNVSFKEVGDYITVPRGGYDLEVRVAGTDTVALMVPGVHFDRGRTYTIYAVGTLGGAQPLGAIVSRDFRGFNIFGSREAGGEAVESNAQGAQTGIEGRLTRIDMMSDR